MDDYNNAKYQFGGWEKPTMKQYSETGNICSQDQIDLDSGNGEYAFFLA